MKKGATSLVKLESIIDDKAQFIIEPAQGVEWVAIRTTDGRIKGRTHNLRLNTETGLLYWENHRSNWKSWTHQFENGQAGIAWWNRMIMLRAVQNKLIANGNKIVPEV